jgi:hypothetical protein
MTTAHIEPLTYLDMPVARLDKIALSDETLAGIAEAQAQSRCSVRCRATLYALAAGDEVTVFHPLGLFKAELDVVQTLMGGGQDRGFPSGRDPPTGAGSARPRLSAGASPTPSASPVSCLRKGT